MLATASWHGLADPFDPIEALRHSAAYLRELVNQFGNLGLELCGRLGVREDRSRPIIDDLEPWLRAKLALISQKSKLAEAIRYALSRWAGLTRFLGDGRIEIAPWIVQDQLDAFFFDQATGSAIIDVRVS
jgi:Transposase IS66 family